MNRMWIYIILAAAIGVPTIYLAGYWQGKDAGVTQQKQLHAKAVASLEKQLREARLEGAERVAQFTQELEALEAESERRLREALKEADDHVQECWNTELPGPVADDIWVR